jgi:hypothetical protein
VEKQAGPLDALTVATHKLRGGATSAAHALGHAPTLRAEANALQTVAARGPSRVPPTRPTPQHGPSWDVGSVMDRASQNRAAHGVAPEPPASLFHPDNHPDMSALSEQLQHAPHDPALLAQRKDFRERAYDRRSYEGEGYIARKFTPRAEVALPPGAALRPDQQAAIHQRYLTGGTAGPTAIHHDHPADFARNPERGVSDVADYRTAKYVDDARRRAQAIPQAIAPKMAALLGKLAALQVFDARALFTS